MAFGDVARCRPTVCSYLGHWLQDGLRSLRHITENVQVGSIHVLSAGQQNCDLEKKFGSFIFLKRNNV